MSERWLPIVGWEGLYEVSDLGAVRRVGSPVPKVQSENRGYMRVGLCGPGRKQKCAAVHRLVLEAFIGPAPPNHDGGHLDGRRDNNALGNLAWVSRPDNQLHRHAHGSALWGATNPNATLTGRQVAEIRALAPIVPTSELAARYGVHRSAVQKIKRGESWRTDASAKTQSALAAIASARRA